MDLKIYETSNGGDIFIPGKDAIQVQGFVNMPYLALFGGNIKQSTPKKRNPAEQDFSWWGNQLLFPSLQINSETERALMNVALNSAGRILIEQAVKTDLEFMKPFAQVTVSVDIIGIASVKINIKIQEPDNLQAREFIYIWDGTLIDMSPNNEVVPFVNNPGYTPYVYNIIEDRLRNYILWR